MRIRIVRQVTLEVARLAADRLTEETFLAGAEFVVVPTLPNEFRGHGEVASTTFFLTRLNAVVVLPDDAWLRWRRLWTVECAAKVLGCSDKQVYALLKEGGLAGPDAGPKVIHGDSVWRCYRPKGETENRPEAPPLSETPRLSSPVKKPRGRPTKLRTHDDVILVRLPSG